MERDKEIYELLQQRYKDDFRIGKPYTNAIEKWALILLAGFIVLLFITLTAYRFYPTKYISLAVSFSFILFFVSFIVYGISFIATSVREFVSPTSMFFTPLIQRVADDRAFFLQLSKYSAQELQRVLRRLEHTQKRQSSWISYIIGAASKLGLVPAAFALYALYTEILTHKLPSNVDVPIMAMVVGLSLGAAQSNWMILKIESMLFAIEEALVLHPDAET